jgi:hypothetical protein
MKWGSDSEVAGLGIAATLNNVVPAQAGTQVPKRTNRRKTPLRTLDCAIDSCDEQLMSP